MPESTHISRYVPAFDAGRRPLVLLHGSEGAESDLLPLAGELSPGAAQLGIRGTVVLESGYAFFHRFPDRRVNEADLLARVPVLARFIETSCATHDLRSEPLAVGFSNGAIMAAALLATHPGLLAGAILFRSLSPFTDDFECNLANVPVLLIDGANDARRSAGDGLRLAERLRRAGAQVTHHVLPAGHSITAGDRVIARDWIRVQGF